MLKEQCISVTDLRTETKKCLENLGKEPKYIFVNNTPIAVLLDIDEFETKYLQPMLVELKKNEVSAALAERAGEARKTKKADLMNL